MEKVFKNVVGYPALNNNIYRTFKKMGYKVVLGVPTLFEKDIKAKHIVVIDSFAILESCNLPIIGYAYSKLGVYLKEPVPKKPVTNEVLVKQPALCDRKIYPNIKVLLEVLSCTTDQELKDIFEKYDTSKKKPKTATDKWLRFVYMENKRNESRAT